MSKFMTTLFENIKNRANYLTSQRYHTIMEQGFVEESQDANDLAQAICEEMERLHERIDRVDGDLVNRIRTIEVAMRIE